MNDIAKLLARVQSMPPLPPDPPNIDGDPGSGDDGQMEARLAALEAAHQDTREKLVRIETRLDAVATKTDISDLRGEIQGMQVKLHQEINAQTWKLVTFVCSFGTALVAATYFIAKHVS